MKRYYYRKKIICCQLQLWISTLCFAQNNDIAAIGVYKAPWFVERFKITAGLFVPVNNTNIRVGSNNDNAGTDIDFEDDLGFKTTSLTFLADVQWRASRRSRFDFSYYRINRKSTKTYAFGKKYWTH